MRENLPAMLAARAQVQGDHPAMRFKSDGRWLDITYGKMNSSVQAVAKGLLELGVNPGDRVGIMSWNRPAWSLADFGIMRAQCVVVPLYPTLTGQQVEHILRDADVEILFVGGEQELQAVLEARPGLPSLRKILVFDDDAVNTAEGLDSFAEWAAASEELASDEVVNQRQEAIGPDDVFTIIYTSGTTGEPKGAMLSHANAFHQFRAVAERFDVGPSDRSLCFLPLSHAFERTWSFFVFHQGATNCYLKDPKQIIKAMAEAKPTAMSGVPRLFEKIHATMYDKVERGSKTRRKMFEWALATGKEYHWTRQKGQFVNPFLRLKYAVANALVLRKIRAVVGGPKNFFAAGGAALAKEIEETFFAAGLLVCQGYGLTETSPMISCNAWEFLRFGTVGKPVVEVEVRIGEESEIQMRGPNVMKGYWRRPEETAAMFTEDGWFKTGDVGVLDPDGLLRVTDRIKDLIITSGGKNIAPANIEMQVGKDHYIEQIAVVGDGRRYVGALIMPSFEALEAWAAEKRIAFADRAELLRNSSVVEFLRERIQRQSGGLASFERIKRFHLLENGFSLKAGEITPTLKIKRKVIQERYKEIIDRLYQGN